MLYLLHNCFTKEKSLQVPGLCFVSLICHRKSVSHWGAPKMQHTQEVFHYYPKHSQNLYARTIHLVLFLIVSTMNRLLLVTVDSCRETPCTISAVLEFCMVRRVQMEWYQLCKTHIPSHAIHVYTIWIPHCYKEKQAFSPCWKDCTAMEGENDIAHFNLLLLLLK